MNKKRLIIVAAALAVCFIIGIVLFLRRDKPVPISGTLVTSDIVATNIVSPAIYQDTSVSFFTGTTAARLDLEKPLLDSRPLLSHRPYERTRKAVFDQKGGGLLVSLEYPGEDSFIQLSNTHPGIRWTFMGKDSESLIVVPATSATQQIIDATIEDNIVYALGFNKRDDSVLFSYNTKSRSITQLLGSTSANSVVGILDDSLVLRNAKGEVIFYNVQDKTTKTIKAKGGAFVDPVSHSVVVTDTTLTKEYYPVVVFDASGKKKHSFNTEYRYAYVSNGRILALDKQAAPGHILIHDIASKEAKKYVLKLGNERIQEAIMQILFVRNSPSLVAFVTASNQLMIGSYDDSYKETLSALPAYKTPSFSRSEFSGISIKSSPGLPEATIITDPKNISAALAAIKESCSCDPGQINKIWLNVNQTVPQPTANPDDYTGDGAPPEAHSHD